LLWTPQVHRVRELGATGSAGVPWNIKTMARFA